MPCYRCTHIGMVSEVRPSAFIKTHHVGKLVNGCVEIHLVISSIVGPNLQHTLHISEQDSKLERVAFREVVDTSKVLRKHIDTRNGLHVTRTIVERRVVVGSPKGLARNELQG